MEKKLISSGSRFEEEVGYSRAVAVGNTIYVSGCTGYNYLTNEISEDVIEQAEQTLKNIEFALKEAGSSMKDIVRIHYLFSDVSDFSKCKPLFKKYFSKIRPAVTAIGVQLHEPIIKIEIEVTAVKTT